MTFKSGQTVFDANCRAFEFHHEHNGVNYCYPIYELDDSSYGVVEETGDALVGLATVFAEEPSQKLSDKAVSIAQEILELDERKSAYQKEANAASSRLSQAERELSRWKEKHGALHIMGKMLEGHEMHYLMVSGHNAHMPIGLSKKDVMAFKVMWDSTHKAFRFAKKRSSTREGDDILHIYETLEELHGFVSMLFKSLTNSMRQAARDRPQQLFDDSYGYSVEHFSTAKKWVKHWPHLEIPEDLLEAEASYALAQKAVKLRAAKEAVEALQLDG